MDRTFELPDDALEDVAGGAAELPRVLRVPDLPGLNDKPLPAPDAAPKTPSQETVNQFHELVSDLSELMESPNPTL